MLKRIVLVALAVALLVPLGLAGIWVWDQAANPAAAQSTDTESEYSPAETITVVGNGTSSIMPDIASVSIGVETKAETIREAVDENEAKMMSILAALKEAGVAEKDIQTSNYSIQLEQYPEPMGRVEGTDSAQPAPQYRVSNMVQVTIRDLDKVSDVLDSVIEAGANNLWGVSFGVDDKSAAIAEARAKATEDALARAGALAELNKVELGPVMSISEVISGGNFPMPMAESALKSGGGAISPGSVEIGYQVQITYFITR